MSKKLHIPAPKDDADSSLNFSVIVSIFVFLIMGFFLIQTEAPNIEPDKKHSLSKKQTQKKRAEKFKEMAKDKLNSYDLTDLDLISVFRFGPSKVSEFACEKQTSFTLAVDEELSAIVRSRNINAPWGCIIRKFFTDKLQEKTKNETEKFMVALEAMDEKNQGIINLMLEDFRKTRRRPSTPRFYKWVRRCAFYTKLKSAQSCRRFLKTLAPKQGKDVLESLQQSIQHDRLSDKDFLAAIHALGLWSRHGQPKSWRVKESAALPAYDIDFRIGSVLSLCRFVTSTDTKIRSAAIEELAETTEIQPRVNEKVNVRRWAATCDLAFGGNIENENWSPVLGTRNEHSEDSRYDIAFLYEIGVCKTNDDFPIWGCAIKRWRHDDTEINVALSKSFLETRFMEFEEEEIEEVK